VTKPIKTTGRIMLRISRCEECNFLATDPSKLRKQIRKEQSAPILIKPLENTAVDGLSLEPTDMKNADETDTTTYQCMICGQGFADETKLSKHMLKEHGPSVEVPVGAKSMTV
jgi:hypothetical protein